MVILPPAAPAGNYATPAPTSNARRAGDWRLPIHLALDKMQVARKRLHNLQTDAACGTPTDTAVLDAAAAEYEAAGYEYLFARGDAAESLIGLLRVARVDPAHADLLAIEIGKLAGVPALEQVIAYLGRRLDAAESRAQADRERVAELEDAVGRLDCELSDRVRPAGRSAVAA